MNPNHIVFVCSRLDAPGGSEKAVVQTSNLLALKGHKVSILILDETDKLFFRVHHSVQIISAPLHFGNVSQGNVITRKLTFQKHVIQLRSILAKIGAGCIVATEYHLSITTYRAAKKLDCRIYSWEHHHFKELRKSRFWNYLLHRSYPRLDGVICLNEDESKLITAIGATAIVIPNYIEKHQMALLSARTILTVARLSHVKGIDTLLQVAKQVLKQHSDWQWKIVGEGDLLDLVQSTIKKENLHGQLFLQDLYLQ